MVAFLLEAPCLAHHSLRLRSADDPDHLLPLPLRPLPIAQKTGKLHVPYLALCLAQLRHCPDDAGLNALMPLQPDPPTLLRTGLLIFGAGPFSAALIFTSFGGGILPVRGPQTN